VLSHTFDAGFRAQKSQSAVSGPVTILTACRLKS